MQVVKPPKSVKEKRWLTINFDEKAKDALIVGDTLKTITSFTCLRLPDRMDVTSSMVEAGSPEIIGKKVTFQTGEGVNGKDYEYVALVMTDFGEPLVEKLILEVRD